jgi:hypothetical protein
MPDRRASRSDLTADQLRLLPRLTTGAVVFYDEGVVFCGKERITGMSLDDLLELVDAGLLLRLSDQAFELTSYGRRVAGEEGG